MTAQEALNTLILKISCLNDTCANLYDCLKDGKCVFKVEGCNDCEDYKIAKALQKLVDRATPMKPVKKYYITRYGNCGQKKRVDILCPRCASKFINGVRGSIGVFAEREGEFIESINSQKYCMFCSQRIDWSKEDANTTH